jgi:hypothetical protein
MSLNMVQNNYENRKYHYILDNIWNKTYINTIYGILFEKKTYMLIYVSNIKHVT